MSELTEVQQSLTPGAKVFLYKLDLTPIGVGGPDAVFYFTPSCEEDGSPIFFDGQEYTQAAIDLSDVERTGTGENPEPKLSLPNTTKFASSLVVKYRDLVGAEITRTVTYDKFLDGHSLEDPTAIVAYDIFVVEQKLNLNNIFAQFGLRVLADTSDRHLPGRLALKDQCQWNYRRWDSVAGAFVYPEVRPCPYSQTGAGCYFKRDGTPTTLPEEDVCSKDLGGCELRPHPNAELPFGGFPGMARIKV